MAFHNEHSARMTNAAKYTSFSRKEVEPGIVAVMGMKDKKAEVHSYIFSQDKFVPADAKAWLKKQKLHYISFENAVGTKSRPVTFDIAMKIDVPTKKEITPEGYLIVPVRISHPGVFEYFGHELEGIPGLQKMQIVKVWMPEAVLFAPETIKSAENKPFVNDHKMVDSETWVGKAAGFVRDIHKDADNFLAGTAVVTDAEAIDDISNGKKELSAGYDATYVFAKDMPEDAGVPEGVDLVRIKMTFNHIALVDEGRAGHDCKIQDKKGAVMDEELKKLLDQIMATLAAQGEQLKKLAEAEAAEVKPAAGAGAGAEEEDEDEAMDALKKQVATLTKENDELKKGIAPAKVEEAAEDRAAVCDAARKLLPTIDTKGKSTKAIMVEALSAVAQDAKPMLDAVLGGSELTNDSISTSDMRKAFNAVVATLDEQGALGLEAPGADQQKEAEDYGKQLAKQNIHNKK